MVTNVKRTTGSGKWWPSGCLAQGDKELTECLSIRAMEQVQEGTKKWNDLLEDFIDNSESSSNLIVLWMNLDKKRQARWRKQQINLSLCWCAKRFSTGKSKGGTFSLREEEKL